MFAACMITYPQLRGLGGRPDQVPDQNGSDGSLPSWFESRTPSVL